MRIKVEGGKAAQYRIQALQEKFKKRKVPNGMMAERLREIISRTFRNQGNTEPWARLTKPYRDWKAKKVGAATGILVFSGALRQSLEYKGAPKSVSKITDEFAMIGTKVRYAGYHQFGSEHGMIPKRAFYQIGNRDVEELRGIMLKWAVEQVRAGYKSRGGK
jgi:Mu-like prophage protein gpG